MTSEFLEETPSPMRSFFSSTSTDSPRNARARAVDNPTAPAPTTAASNSKITLTRAGRLSGGCRCVDDQRSELVDTGALQHTPIFEFFKRHRAMHGGTVVPDHDVAHAPVVSVDVLLLGRMGSKFLNQIPSLLFGHTHDVGG